MPTIKGPIHIKGNALENFLAEKFKNKELEVRLPFKAKGWRSKQNADMVAGKPLHVKRLKKAKPKGKSSRRKKK